MAKHLREIRVVASHDALDMIRNAVLLTWLPAAERLLMALGSRDLNEVDRHQAVHSAGFRSVRNGCRVGAGASVAVKGGDSCV